MADRTSDPRTGLNGAVAAVLNGERVNAPLSYDELADASGLNRQTLLRLLSPTNKVRRHIDLETLSILAAVFHRTPIDIVSEAEARLARGEGRPASEREEAEAAMRDALARRDATPEGESAPDAGRKSRKA